VRAALACAACALALPAGAGADPVAIENAGFEALYLGGNLPPEYAGDVPPGAFPTGAPPAGWTAFYAGGSAFAGAYLGVLNPGTAADHAPNPAYFPAGAPEGDNAALVYMDGDAGGAEFGIEQELAATLEPDTTYTLTVEVGNIASGAGLVVPYTSFFDLDGFPGYRVQLLAGGVVLAEDAGVLSPGEGVFETATVVHTSASAPAQQGEPLAIRLLTRNQPDVPGVSGLEVDFDDVRLESGPTVGAVPLPPIAVALAGAILAGSGAAALRRRRMAGSG
jgi:hypothetical protein